ncbi:specifically androgen-regulated gene protein [Pagrus major]|uniref:specifically androgen-regulated gene protein n=1 Tax=Pagrus major TaxID=143350 RepID=UPI003CC885C7
MPKGGTWPGGVALESSSNMDSAGSCDSVISMNSGYSDDSMEHLSAEERACLMYLEETIEALEVQEDSGLSNDEPDPVLRAEKMGRMRVNDISSLKSDESGIDQKSDEAEHHTLNQTSEPQSNAKDLDTSANLMTQLKLPVTDSGAGCEIQPSATKADELCVSKDEDGKIKIVSSTGQSAPASEVDLSLIPPPSDFMDEPGNPPQPEKAKDPPPSAGISTNKPEATVDLELLRQRASTKTTSVSSPVVQEPPNKPPDLSPLAVSSGPQLYPPPEAMEPRSPPAVAPKPKKLPANIVLKSHKAAVADGNSGHSVPTSSDRLLLDPQRVRMEALRKLGLLKSDDLDPGPVLSPKLSPQTRRSWAAPSPPISPAAPHTPPMTPSHTRLNSPSPASVPLQSPAAVSPSPPAVQFPDIPAPPAFSDADGPLLSDNEPVTTPPRTPPVLVKQPTPPRFKDVKSATLERSGLGLSSYMDTQGSTEAGQGVSGTQSPSQLRNTRPRPASLGSGKEFSSAQGESSQLGHSTNKEPDLRRSLPAFQHSGDSQKLPRSQGISVLICPRAEKGDERREALKRLGLLRD